MVLVLIEAIGVLISRLRASERDGVEVILSWLVCGISFNWKDVEWEEGNLHFFFFSLIRAFLGFGDDFGLKEVGFALFLMIFWRFFVWIWFYESDFSVHLDGIENWGFCADRLNCQSKLERWGFSDLVEVCKDGIWDRSLWKTSRVLKRLINQKRSICT